MEIFKIILAPLSALIGVLIGHWVAQKRNQTRLFYEKRIDFVSDFIGIAFSNLGYVAKLNNREDAVKGLSELKQFNDLAEKVTFFVGEKTAKSIRTFMNEYTHALMHNNDPSSGTQDFYPVLKQSLLKLSKQLRQEIFRVRRRI